MNPGKLKPAEINALFDERDELLSYLKPPAPDPEVWPPKGWQVHPDYPAGEYLIRIESAQSLRDELFGSPEKTAWLKKAAKRVEEIDKKLAKHYFPEPKEEGTQRKTAAGFVAMLKTGLRRVVDREVIEVVLEKCPEAKAAIDFVPTLRLKEYRALVDEAQEQLDDAFVITPETPKFDIVRKKK